MQLTIERVRHSTVSTCCSAADGTLTRPVTNQGLLVDRGEAGMFQG